MSKQKPTAHQVILGKIQNAAKSAMHLPEFEKDLKLLCSILHEMHIPKQAVPNVCFNKTWRTLQSVSGNINSWKMYYGSYPGY
ncbi:hypothetical protein ISR92_00140 [Patescibacteria group bacterium]|nr:hypothetical protein [Patescibacteria group bacterium]